MGLAPSEYRSMSPMEVQDWYNANRPRKYYGSMSEDAARELTDWMEENPEEFE